LALKGGTLKPTTLFSPSEALRTLQELGGALSASIADQTALFQTILRRSDRLWRDRLERLETPLNRMDR
jgi:hypothetical protein